MKTFLYLIPLLLLVSCDKGIEPVPEVTELSGFAGTIYFQGTWQQDITRTHLIVFEQNLDSPDDFVLDNLKFIGPEIPFGSTQFNYNSTDSAYIPIGAGTFEYVAVIQSTTENLSLRRSDWYVCGLYTIASDTTVPGTLVIPENKLVRNINIICDFDNPPPQPPEG